MLPPPQGPLTANDRVFDNHYYTEVVNQTGRRGWFSSDINIARPNTRTVRSAPFILYFLRMYFASVRHVLHLQVRIMSTLHQHIDAVVLCSSTVFHTVQVPLVPLTKPTCSRSAVWW